MLVLCVVHSLSVCVVPFGLSEVCCLVCSHVRMCIVLCVSCYFMFVPCPVACLSCMLHSVWCVVQHTLLCGLCVNRVVLQNQDEQQLKDILKAGIGEPLKMVVYNSKSRNCRGGWRMNTLVAHSYSHKTLGFTACVYEHALHIYACSICAVYV